MRFRQDMYLFSSNATGDNFVGLSSGVIGATVVACAQLCSFCSPQELGLYCTAFCIAKQDFYKF